MKFYAIIVITLIILSKTNAFEVAKNFAIPRNCTQVFSKVTPKYVPYEETYKSRNWWGVSKIKSRINYKLENHISYQKKAVCCPGYSDFGSNLCKPICSHSCGENSVCSAPETCKCNDGYVMDHSLNECKPVCFNECINGYCAQPDTCNCNDGYRMLPDLITCTPICDSCSNLEYCVEPHICRCINGYTRVSIERVDSAIETECKAVCDRECVNANCVEPNLCKCHEGFADFDDDAFTCEPICVHGCKNGYCSAPNTCTCFPGYEKSDNSSHICQPICTDTCVNADCIAPNTCSCFDGFIPVGGDWSHICQPFCSSLCENGLCTDPEICSCNAGYKSINNKTECEPICTNTCVMGNCTAPDVCTCYEGYRLANESTFQCEPICSEDCINGECIAPDQCVCNDGYEKKNITDENSKCIIICNCENGYCHETSSICVACMEGYDLESSDNSTICKPHCEGGCENGQCTEPHKCECNENYISDVDTAGNPICVKACGGDCIHGNCDPENNTCSCLYGWTGKYCDEAFLCSLVVSENHSLFLQFNESNYNESEIIDEPWEGPNCNIRCLQEASNMTKCVGQFDREYFNMSCFLSIDAPCNTHVTVQSRKGKAESNATTILTFLTVITTLVIATICTVYFIRKQKRKKSIELVKTIPQAQRREEDNLIESENDGISL